MTTSDDTPAVEPLCAEPEFAVLLDGLVADCAPRLFALVEEEGERVDGAIVAWGMEFEDRAEVVGADGGLKGTFGSADSAHRLFSHGRKMRLVWYDPDAATRHDEAA